MNMKLAPLALAALMAAMPLATLAQTAPTQAPPAADQAGEHRHHGGRWMNDLKSLNLTADQQAKIDGYVSAFRTNNKGVDPATRHANMKALRSQIESVLTPDQLAQLKAKMKSDRANAPKPQ